METGFIQDKEGYFIYKDPSATKDYKIDWSNWLVSGETIINMLWTVPSGITLEMQNATPSAAIIVLSGGTVNNNYKVTCHIVTSLDNEDDKEFRVVILNQ